MGIRAERIGVPILDDVYGMDSRQGQTKRQIVILRRYRFLIPLASSSITFDKLWRGRSREPQLRGLYSRPLPPERAARDGAASLPARPANPSLPPPDRTIRAGAREDRLRR